MSATTRPELAMLWEASDPHEALRQRFGFNDAEEAGQWLAVVLAKHWGVHVSSCVRLLISAGNALAWLATDDRPLIAKWSVVSRLYPRLAELARLTAWAGRQGMPVSTPLPTLDGTLQLEIDGASLGVQTVVDAVALDVADLDLVRTAGGVLAHLHLTLADYPRVARISARPGRGEPEPLATRLAHTIESARDHVPAVAIDVLSDFLSAGPPDDVAPAQLVHNDFRSANVLCGEGRVVAVLDFEEVMLDYPVIDLAKASVYLGTRFRNWGPVSPETHQALLSGYESVRPLPAGERAWLRALVLWHTVHLVPSDDDPTGWGESVKRLAAAF
jgi:homoserine kinase type II